MIRGFVSVVMLGVTFGAFAADTVTVMFAKKENPNTETLLDVSSSLGNASGKWRVSLKNKRAHGNRGRHFQFLTENGITSGYSALIGSVELAVNGIRWDRLQLKEKNVRRYSGKDGVEGFEFMLNFDGAPVRLRATMKPGSPSLDWEVTPSAKGLAPVTNIDIRVAAIPSFLDCGHGKPTRFSGYRRQVRTDKRLLPPQKGGNVAFDSERVFILEDADYDGSAADKGQGPCAVVLPEPTAGYVGLNDGWTTELHFKPDPSKPFRFLMIEYPDRRFSNAEFEKRVGL